MTFTDLPESFCSARKVECNPEIIQLEINFTNPTKYYYFVIAGGAGESLRDGPRRARGAGAVAGVLRLAVRHRNRRRRRLGGKISAIFCAVSISAYYVRC